MELRTIKQRVENIMVQIPETRGSDKLLQLYYWGHYDGVKINKQDFMKCTDSESIRRSRQKVQSERNDLDPVEEVKHGRDNKQLDFFDFAKQ